MNNKICNLLFLSVSVFYGLNGLNGQKVTKSGVLIEPLEAEKIEIAQAGNLGKFVEGLDEIPEASYNIATATWGIAGAFPPVIWDYHYYDAFYPWYSNDKVTYYDFEGNTGYGIKTVDNNNNSHGTAGEEAHKSVAEKGVAKREQIRKKEEELKRRRHGK